MLILQRKVGERVIIGDDDILEVLLIGRNKAQVRIISGNKPNVIPQWIGPAAQHRHLEIENCNIYLMDTFKNGVSLGFDAPKDVVILRDELRRKDALH